MPEPPATNKVKILSAEQLPLYPSGITPDMEHYLRQLHNYLRRLWAILGNITIETESMGDAFIGWRYDNVGNVFQYKTVADPTWRNIPDGNQPQSSTVLETVTYNSGDHKLYKDSKTNYVLRNFTATQTEIVALTGAGIGVAVAVLEDIDYDSTAHKLTQDAKTIYALADGSPSVVDVVTFVNCT